MAEEYPKKNQQNQEGQNAANPSPNRRPGEERKEAGAGGGSPNRRPGEDKMEAERKKPTEEGNRESTQRQPQGDQGTSE